MLDDSFDGPKDGSGKPLNPVNNSISAADVLKKVDLYNDALDEAHKKVLTTGIEDESSLKVPVVASTRCVVSHKWLCIEQSTEGNLNSFRRKDNQ